MKMAQVAQRYDTRFGRNEVDAAMREFQEHQECMRHPLKIMHNNESEMNYSIGRFGNTFEEVAFTA